MNHPDGVLCRWVATSNAGTCARKPSPEGALSSTQGFGISIISRRGRGDERFGRILESRQGLTQKSGSVNPAMKDSFLEFVSPAQTGESLPRQMNHSIKILQSRSIDLPEIRIPVDFILLGFRCAAHQRIHFMPAGLQEEPQLRPDKTRCTGDGNLQPGTIGKPPVTRGSSSASHGGSGRH